jgi:hypothetical protein
LDNAVLQDTGLVFLAKYCWYNQIKVKGISETCGKAMRGEHAHRVLVATSGGKRPLGKPLRRGEYSITIDLSETGWALRVFI